MKLILLLTMVVVTYGEKLDRTYLPPNAQASGGSDVILQAPVSRPIVVLDEGDLQRQISGSAQEEIQRPVVTNVVEVQRPIVSNVVTDSAAVQRPIGFVVNANNQAVNDVVHIGNRGKIFIPKPNPVQYNEVQYSEPRYQIVEQRPERTQAALERNAAVLRQDYKSEGDAYAYAYETENGIWAEENGVATNGVNSHGAYSYIGDDGVQYSMSYTADENGFQPQGDHLPTPHPIPEEILRSLEQNARDEAAGIFDDGSYDELKYGGEYSGNQQIGIVSVTPSYPNLPTIIENRPSVPTVINQVESNEDSVAVTNPLLPKFRNPGYRYPTILVNHRNNLSPVVNTLIQDVTPSTVNKAYLPPVKRKVPSDKLSSKAKGKSVVVIRNRKPESKKNENKS